MDYTIIRSGRKTLAAQITADGLLIRAPLRMTDKEIAAVIMAAIAAYEADTGQSGGVVTGIRRSTGESLLPQMPDVVPQDGVFIRPVRKHDKRNWKKAI